jgi:hypothetical protein
VCGCFHRVGNSDSSICGFLWLTCSELVSCEHSNNICYQPDHICVRHPKCHDRPVCYPLSKANQQICPPITSKLNRFQKAIFFLYTVTNITTTINPSTTTTTTISRFFKSLLNKNILFSLNNSDET